MMTDSAGREFARRDDPPLKHSPRSLYPLAMEVGSGAEL